MVSENYSLCSSTLSSQNNRKYSKKMCKNKCVCYNRIIWFNMKKWRWKWKIDHIYTTNRPKPRHGHKYTNYKMGHSTMMVICINQHLSNIWSSVHEKVKQHWEAKLKKSVAYKKTCIYLEETDCFSLFYGMEVSTAFGQITTILKKASEKISLPVPHSHFLPLFSFITKIKNKKKISSKLMFCFFFYV